MRYFLAAMVGLVLAVMAFGLVAVLTCFVVVPTLDRAPEYATPIVILIVIGIGGVLAIAAATGAAYLGAKLVLGRRVR